MGGFAIIVCVFEADCYGDRCKISELAIHDNCLEKGPVLVAFTGHLEKKCLSAIQFDDRCSTYKDSSMVKLCC